LTFRKYLFVKNIQQPSVILDVVSPSGSFDIFSNQILIEPISFWVAEFSFSFCQ